MARSTARSTEAFPPGDDRYRTLVECTPVPMFVLRDGIVLYVNPAAGRLFGAAAPHELVGTPALDRVHPAFHSVTMARWRRLSEGAASTPRIEVTFLRLDGTEVDVEIEGTRIGFNGAPAIHKTVRDISERKRAEAALRESEARLRDITVSMGEWAWEVDRHGVYTYSSERGSDLLGRSTGEIVGKTPFDFMSPGEASRVEAIFADIAAHKAPIRDLENWNIGKNGEARCLLTNAVPMLDAAGNLTGYRGVDRDITDRKRAVTAVRDGERYFKTMFD